MCAWHPSLGRPNPHSRFTKDEHFDPWRDEDQDPADALRPPRQGLPLRALLVVPSVFFLLIGLGIEPGWGRFMAWVGLLLLGILVVVTWSARETLGRLLLQTVFVGGLVAYVVTLFS